MMIHGHVPKLVDTILISLEKDKPGNVIYKDNNQPIAITCAASKLFEVLILH